MMNKKNANNESKRAVLTYTKEGIKIDHDYLFIIPPEYEFFIYVNNDVVGQEIGGYPYVRLSSWKWALIKAILEIPDSKTERSDPILYRAKKVKK